MNGYVKSGLLSFIATVAYFHLAAAAPPDPGATNSASSRPSMAQLKAMAEHYEKSGSKAEAAGTYEQIIKADPAAQTVLAPRLVDLYIDTKQLPKAMAWAREVMKTNPDPQAYLAGVYTRIGMTKEARAILAEEIKKANEPRREMLLNWQLADASEKAGDIEAARAALADAAKSAESSPDAPAARKRLISFVEKHPPKDDKPAN